VADVQVRWAATNAPADTETWLTGEERGRLVAFQRDDDRARFLAAHALARVMVARQFGIAPAAVRLTQRCPRCGGPHGQPAITLPDGIGIPPRITWSHAGGLALVATSADPVGIDAEPRGAARPGVADVALSGREQAELARFRIEDRMLALTRWWVRKEAILKAAGVGFDVDPVLLEVTSPDLPPAVVSTGVDLGGPMQIYDIELDIGPGYDVALAVRSSNPVRVDAAAISF
jgi:4'-phosphopantetheinyl transferase